MGNDYKLIKTYADQFKVVEVPESLYVPEKMPISTQCAIGGELHSACDGNDATYNGNGEFVIKSSCSCPHHHCKHPNLSLLKRTWLIRTYTCDACGLWAVI